MSGVPILVEGGALRVLVVGGGAVADAQGERRSPTSGARCASSRRVSRARDARAGGRRAHRAGRARPYDARATSATRCSSSPRRTIAPMNARSRDDARAAHRLVNVADRAGDGNFATMAMHRAGDLVVGVSAGGVPAPRRAFATRSPRASTSRYATALDDARRAAPQLLDARRSAHAGATLARAVSSARTSATRSSRGRSTSGWRRGADRRRREPSRRAARGARAARLSRQRRCVPALERISRESRRARGGAALDVQSHRALPRRRRGARRRRRLGALRRATRRRRERLRLRATRSRCGRASLPRRVGHRLDGRRRSADPRPGARRVGGEPSRVGRGAQPTLPDARCSSAGACAARRRSATAR